MADEKADRLARLELLRDMAEVSLAGEIGARDFASVSREYRAILSEIAELSNEGQEVEVDAVDEIAQRRAARRAGPAKGSARAKRPS